LPPRYGAIAQNTDAVVIERMPLSPSIGGLDDLEFFFGKKFGIHLRNRRTKSNRLGFEIGGRAEAHIR
jgi:hypothetical protein